MTVGNWCQECGEACNYLPPGSRREDAEVVHKFMAQLAAANERVRELEAWQSEVRSNREGMGVMTIDRLRAVESENSRLKEQLGRAEYALSRASEILCDNEGNILGAMHAKANADMYFAAKQGKGENSFVL